MIDPVHRPELRRTLLFLALMALGIAAAWLAPTMPQARGLASYLPLHLLLETVSVIVAALVFAVGWNSYGEDLPSNIVLLGCAFLAVATLDFSHALSFAGMPDYVTPSGPEKAIDFWLVARAVAAAALLIVALRPWRPFARRRTRYLLLVSFLAIAAAAHVLVLWHPEAIPRTFVPDTGLTPFKVIVEYAVIAISLLAAAVLWRRMRAPLPYNAAALFGAVCAMAMAEFLFTLYGDVTDGFNLLGHLYKVISYLFIYRAIVVSTVERPYRQLRDSQAMLQTTLDALPDLLFEIDLGGRVHSINESSTQLLAVPPEAAEHLTVADLFDAEAAGAVMAALGEAHEHGGSRGRQYQLTSTRGRRWHELSVARKPAEPGHPPHYVVLSHDIDVLRRAEAELAASRDLLQAVIDTAPLRIFWKDRDLRYLGCNPAFAKDAGLASPEQLIGLDEYGLGWRDQAELYRADDRRVIETGVPLLSYDEPQTTPSGSIIWLRTSKVALHDSTGATSGVLGIYEDITDRKRAEQALRRSEAALTAAQAIARVGSWHYDPAHRRFDGTEEGLRMFGLDPGTTPDLDTLASAIHPDDRDLAVLAARSGEPFDGEFRVVVDGRTSWVHVRAKVEVDAQGRPVGGFATTQDVSDRKLFEDRVYTLAHFDTLTGLPNRAQLEDRLRFAVSAARRNRSRVALMFIDLDRFKDVNDSLGHSVGDALLVQLAQRLRDVLSEDDVVSRLGGDEFIVMLPDTDVRRAGLVARRLLEVISRPYQVEEYDLNLTASIGIAVYPEDGDRPELLSRCADTAMYRAKQDGRNCVRFFTQQMQEHSARNLQLVNDLRHALARGQLSLVYQPQIALDDGRLVGVEALLRWQHPQLGAVPPAEFIPIAEDSGLIIPIGEWVVRCAARQTRRWMDEGLGPMVTAVNLSAVQLRHCDLPGTLGRILAEENLGPEHLELELTEGVAMHDPRTAVTVLNALHARGMRLALDDFGTGYSSLGYLKAFRVYKLKIDRSFIRDIGVDPDDRAIVGTIIAIARQLGLRTIAEGVETAEQLAFLREQGCDEIQGFYYSRPLAPADLAAFARTLPRQPARS
ncbi:MAG: EAL domain-containing protein [Actinobacteria bacterium]|nr:EAL domain-containing protein [Actinomycetota bacterium]